MQSVRAMRVTDRASTSLAVNDGGPANEGQAAEALRYVKLGWQPGDGNYFSAQWGEN